MVLPGSCNGLQHYAALGLDAKGGAQVNLVPSCKPQDVYSGVCDVVKEKVRFRGRAEITLSSSLERCAWYQPMGSLNVLKRILRIMCFALLVDVAKDYIPRSAHARNPHVRRIPLLTCEYLPTTVSSSLAIELKEKVGEHVSCSDSLSWKFRKGVPRRSCSPGLVMCSICVLLIIMQLPSPICCPVDGVWGIVRIA